MPNPVYTEISNMVCEHILLITFLNKPVVIFLAQFCGFKYFYQTQIILFIINPLFTLS